MDSTFPLGFPTPTALYLVLYVATFIIHQALVGYVVAGSLYVAWATIAPGRGDTPRAEQPLASALRDWLPFVLSATITAGVAPLLFIQIVYPRHFYTANLLLSWRWMIVIPVLITAFYLLYLIKGATFSKWSYQVRAAVVLAVAACFLFVGFCWTANHLVANNESAWPEVYASGNVSLSATLVALRMLVWVGGACASMAVIAGWQLAAQSGSPSSQPIAVEIRRLARFSLGGLALASAAATAYLLQSDQAVSLSTLRVFALPYVVAAVIGVLVQAAAWAMQWRLGMNRRLLAMASFGYILALVGASVLRETVRLASVDIAELYQRNADAAAVGGFSVFLVFVVLNVAVITGCIWIVQKGIRKL